MRTYHTIPFLTWLLGVLLPCLTVRAAGEDETVAPTPPPPPVEMPRIEIDTSKLDPDMNTDGEIFNGSAASSGEFPAFALLVYSGTEGGGCGGVLITTTHVLTAAHCFVRSDLSTFTPVGVRIGATTSLTDGTFYSVTSAVFHPNFSLSQDGALTFFLRNDVAVLTLGSTVTGVTPLSFNRDSTVTTTSGQAVTAIGFGTFDAAGSSISTFLRKTTVGTQTDSACANAAASANAVYANTEHMCTFNSNTGACRGDSGGPVLTSDNVILGVLSFGSSFCPADTADYWTDLWNYAGWIDEQIGTPGTPTPQPTTAAPNATPSPTLATPQPTTSPTVCFSEVATVSVQNQGPIDIPNLSIGDKVLTANGYQTLYAFAHQDSQTPTEFLQIYTSTQDYSPHHNTPPPLEITSQHLLYVVDKPYPVPAHSIQVGDVLRSSGSSHDDGGGGGGVVVKKITTIYRNGFYAPVTTDGTITVDGIVTSCYVALQSETRGEYVELQGGISLGLSQHFFAHLTMTPVRMVCLGISPDLCKLYDANGLAYFAKYGFAAARWANELSLTVQIVLIPWYLLIMGFLYGLECIFGSKLALVIVLAATATAIHGSYDYYMFVLRTKKSTKTSNKVKGKKACC